MKKLLAVVLAAVMALSLGVVAFAAEYDATYTYDVKDGSKTAKNEIYPDDSVYLKLNGIKVDVPQIADPSRTTAVTLNEKDFTDGDLWKVKFDKGGDNSKMIAKISLSEKNYGGDRGPWVKIETKADYTTDEFKIKPSMTLTAKDDITIGGVVRFVKGDKINVDFGTIYISNDEDPADQDYAAGTGGVVLKPTKNDDNEITWEDEQNTIAVLKFMGDDNQTKFFPKLSTKWEDADYAEYFADQDAFIFNFKGSVAGETKISSTSRATLELYNPYYDSDEDEYTVDPENCIVYQVQEDGTMAEAAFKVVENEDGDMVFQTKTRELGIYIIAEKPYTTAVEDVETPDDGKAIPDTGIWA
ncbi:MULTISPECIES: acid shock protein [Anaerotruncus]|uniref:acid shock protein n=2 Tax=Oscillospiraceae TaxID=216572 RepID=UPI000C78B0DB|nr:acid shock protein [Anaerotruncus massiliensis (ex Togo et al. 2019)]